MAINTDVKRLSERWELPVAMPEEMPGIKVALIPDSQAIMTKDNGVSIDNDIHEVSDIKKAGAEFLSRFLIMSAPDQDNIAIQPVKERPPVPPGKISQVIDKVSLSDPGVPLGD